MQESDLKVKPIRTNRKEDEVKEEEEEEEAVLSPASRMFHEPDYNIHIIAIMGWRGEPNIDTIKENLADTMLKHPRFSSKQVVDENDKSKIKLIPTEVKVDEHIVIPALDPNMDSPDQFLDNYISDLSNTPLDPSKPLWDLHILILKTSDSDFVSIFRFHHSLGDGTTLVSMLLSNTRKTSDPNSLPNFPSPKKRNTDPKMRGTLRHCLNKLWLRLQVLVNTFTDLLMFVATALFLRDTETPMTEIKGPPQHRFIRRTVSLDDIKLVKNATNSTVNDVVLGITQAGFSRYLNRRYGEDEEEARNNILKGIRFRASVVVNLRGLKGLKASLETSENKKRLAEHGNCFGFVLLPLNISMVQNPLDHVRQAKIVMDRKKQSLEPICTSYILQLVHKLFGYKVATSLEQRVLSHTSLEFSNVMGPMEEISYCGLPMTHLSATNYGQSTAMMVHVVSYTNKLTFSICVDERRVPDPYRLGDDIMDSLDQMKQTIIQEDKLKHD